MFWSCHISFTNPNVNVTFAIMVGTVMANEFEALTADELYLLHLEITAVLKERLAAKKELLEQQLQRLLRPKITRPRGLVGPTRR